MGQGSFVPRGCLQGKQSKMRNISKYLPIILCLALLLMCFDMVAAIPPLPSSFYGTVTVNGDNLPVGTVIQAKFKNKIVAFTQSIMHEGKSVFSMDIPGDDASTSQVEGGVEGDVIHFIVGGLMANETGKWQSGTYIELNLTVTSESTAEPPQPTRTPLPSQTPIKLPTQPMALQPTNSPALQATDEITEYQATNTIPGLTPTISQSDDAELNRSPIVNVEQIAESFTPTSTKSSIVHEDGQNQGNTNKKNHSSSLMWVLSVGGLIGVLTSITLIFRKKKKTDKSLFL